MPQRNNLPPTKKALSDKLSRLWLNNPIQIIEPKGYTYDLCKIRLASELQDSNLRPRVPKTRALTKLR